MNSINFIDRRTLLAAGAASLTVGQSFAHAQGGKEKIRIGQIGVGHAHASKLSVYRA